MDYLNEISKLKADVDELQRMLRDVPSHWQGPRGFYAKITGYTLVDDNFWKYDWQEVDWTMTSILGTLTSGLRSGPYTITNVGTTGYGWNTNELFNTDLDAGSGWSDQMITMFDTFATPLTVNVEAINPISITQTGAIVYPIVWMRPYWLEDGEVAYIFTGWNTPALSSAGS